MTQKPLRTTVFILAAGASTRWGEHLGIPKQLIQIAGQTILERTVQQVRTHGAVTPIVVTHDQRLHLPDCEILAPRQCARIVDTLASTSDMWTRRNVILLGDVYYTDRTMKRILDFGERLGFFGRNCASWFSGCAHRELFAMVFEDSQFERVHDAINAVRTWSASGGRCKLWAVYRHLSGISLNDDRFQARSPLFCPVNDATDDFDVPDDYERAIDRYNRLARSWKCFVPAWYALARAQALLRRHRDVKQPIGRDSNLTCRVVQLASMHRPNKSELRVTLENEESISIEVLRAENAGGDTPERRKLLTVPLRKWPALLEMICTADRAVQQEIAKRLECEVANAKRLVAGEPKEMESRPQTSKLSQDLLPLLTSERNQ